MLFYFIFVSVFLLAGQLLIHKYDLTCMSCMLMCFFHSFCLRAIIFLDPIVQCLLLILFILHNGMRFSIMESFYFYALCFHTFFMKTQLNKKKTALSD